MSTMSVLLFIRSNRGNDDVEATIYVRVTIAGERYELLTKRLVLLPNWSADSGRVKGNTSAAKPLNAYLDSLTYSPIKLARLDIVVVTGRALPAITQRRE